MNPIFDPTFPHGTPEGYSVGCRSAHCPEPIPCRVVHVRYRGDYVFRTRLDEGMTLAEILGAEEADREAIKAAERAARRKPHKKRDPYRNLNSHTRTPLQNEVAALHAEGLTDRQIGERIGKTRDQVRSARRFCGLPVNRERPVTVADQIRELHAEGLNDAQIAARLDKSTNHISTVRRQIGLALIPMPRTKVPSDEVIQFHGLGWTDKQLAAHFNTTTQIIRARRHHLRLPVNPARKEAA